MPSDRRLHPLSFLFAIAGQLRQFLLPGLVVIVTAGAAGGEFEPWLMAVVVAVSMVASCTVAGIAGALIPLTLKRLGADPATASSIFLTTASDIASMGVFLTLSTILLL